MEGFSYIDLFATKGIEYLLVIGFLIAFIVYWALLDRKKKAAAGAVPVTLPSRESWFNLAKGLFYHQGHTWAMPGKGNLATVGIDDFAQKFLGKPQKFMLPKVGEQLNQGKTGWKLEVDSKQIEMLSPVSGKVAAVNSDLLKKPELLTDDPYKSGWLLKVETPDWKADLKNLLKGKMVVAWMEDAVNSLRQKMSAELGMVLQDGGIPVTGFGKELSSTDWDKIAAEFFLTD